jgi:hypothetical protein
MYLLYHDKKKMTILFYTNYKKSFYTNVRVFPRVNVREIFNNGRNWKCRILEVLGEIGKCQIMSNLAEISMKVALFDISER